jgi:hypothetical protein
VLLFNFVNYVFLLLCYVFLLLCIRIGAWGSVVVKALRYKSDGLGIDSRWCHTGEFSVATDGTMCPGVDSASKYEYQGFPLGVKAAGT